MEKYPQPSFDFVPMLQTLLSHIEGIVLSFAGFTIKQNKHEACSGNNVKPRYGLSECWNKQVRTKLTLSQLYNNLTSPSIQI